MLKIDSSPTNPAASVADTEVEPPERKKSPIIGPACSRIPIPAVTLQNSTVQSSQNCGVLIADAAETPRGAPALVAEAAPAGRHPGGGTRTVNTPSIITRK